VDSLCYCLFAVGGGPLHPPIPLDGVLALSIFLPSFHYRYGLLFSEGKGRELLLGTCTGIHSSETNFGIIHGMRMLAVGTIYVHSRELSTDRPLLPWLDAESRK